MATIIHHDGREEAIQPANGYNFELAELQRIVGGYIEIVPTKDGRIIVLNEEGKLVNLPINVKASELADLPTAADLEALRKQLGDSLIIVDDDDPLHGPDVIEGRGCIKCVDELAAIEAGHNPYAHHTAQKKAAATPAPALTISQDEAAQLNTFYSGIDA